MFDSHQLVEDLGFCSPALEQILFPLEQQGKTVVLLSDDTQVLALFAVADTVKDSSRQAHRVERQEKMPEKHGMIIPFRAESLLSVAEFIKVQRSTDDEPDDNAADAAANLDHLSITRDGEPRPRPHETRECPDDRTADPRAHSPR